jgi:uncharacterized protein (TIGR01777 family)
MTTTVSLWRNVKNGLLRSRPIMGEDVAAGCGPVGEYSMNILVSGSTGLIGSFLAPCLKGAGHRVTRLVRTAPRPGEPAVVWEPDRGKLNPADLEGTDAAIHLAGENIASGRWTREKKERIRSSRSLGTRLLSDAISQLSRPPCVLISASAVGYYGNRGEEILREDSPAGSGFLAEVCREWEAATISAAKRGIRVVNLRIGMVLTSAGGGLARMLPPFRMGLGGKIGSGRQYLSWITIDDLVRTIFHVLNTDSLRGPVNAVSPDPVTNLEFTSTLGRVLRRPTVFTLPAAVARLVLGEMADQTLLASTRVEPAKLKASGYVFRHPELSGALRFLL